MMVPLSQALPRSCTGRSPQIAFLDAFLSEDGETIVDLSPDSRARVLAAQVKGRIVIPPPPSIAFFVNEQDRPLVDCCCAPQPIRTFT
jgi:hypothetical protein